MAGEGREERRDEIIMEKQGKVRREGREGVGIREGRYRKGYRRVQDVLYLGTKAVGDRKNYSG